MKLFGNNTGKHGRHKGGYRNVRKNFKALLPLCLAVILLAGVAVGGTIAFLQNQTEQVTNSFRAGNIKYTLTLAPNADDANTKYEDTAVSMPTELAVQNSTDLSVTFSADKAPTLPGYIFSGWYYDAACTEAYDVANVSGNNITVHYGDSFDSNTSPNKVDITLYAHWEPITYTVNYNGNGYTAGEMTASTHIYDEAKNLTTNAYTRTGYAFLGWSTDPSATTATYADNASVENLTPVNGGEVDLYAVWKRMDFTLSFDTQAADVANPDSKTVTYEQPYGELPAPTRTGYTFAGWTLSAGGGTYVTKDTIVATAADHTLYAQWTANTYTVSFDTQDDNVANPASITVTYKQLYGTLPTVHRTGYTFVGWSLNKNGPADITPETTVNTASNHTLYAQWAAKSYTIKFHANGGTGTMADQVIKYDVPTGLSPNAFTKLDHSFGGWALTSDGEPIYNDEHSVLNLSENGTINLYAIWIQDSHKVTFDYNGGDGTTASKQVQYGKAYGALPTYPTKYHHLFAGWYTAPEGGTRVYPSDIVETMEDHTLYAHWQYSPANEIIKDLVIKNNPDDNGDGIVDAIYLNFACSDFFEKFNVPMVGLVKGQKYKLSFTESNNATYGQNEKGYGGAIYGSIITSTGTLTPGSIKPESIADGGLIAEYNYQFDSSKGLAYLNSTKNWEMTFTAEESTMYWTWDMGLIQDGPLRDYNFWNIQLVPVEPDIKFETKTLLKPTAYNAAIKSWNSSDYGVKFVFDGASGCETIYYPITGLTAGTEYTITFDHTYTGNFVSTAGKYDYGCVILNEKPEDTAMGDKMSALGTAASNVYKHGYTSGKTNSVTLTFTAAGDTAYWAWNMANTSDNGENTVDVKVTKFSAKHKNGGSITYYTAPSTASTLDLRPDPVPTITLNWDGIDDTNMDAWYPVDEQYPMAGDSYEMAFEPAEGFVMDPITVVIDGTSYVVNPDGTTAGTLAPVYDPATKILTIPAELLTEETLTVAITASAVPADIVIVPEPPQPGDPVVEAGGFILTKNLANVTILPVADFVSGSNYSLVLTPDEGYALPATLKLDICGGVYEVSTTGEHASYSPIWPSYNPETNTLTIPAALLCETEQGVTVTISGETVALLPEEEEGPGAVESEEEAADE